MLSTANSISFANAPNESNDMNAEKIVDAALKGDVTTTAAVKSLVALGYNEADAREQIFIAFGGDDVVEDDAQRVKNIGASRRK
jgi:hypothetical protein